jgi:hypothetical protein
VPGPFLPVGGRPDGDEAARLARAVRRVPPLAMPSVTSTRSLAAFVKRLVRRLTAWEVDPVVQQVNMLREATIESLTALADERASREPEQAGRGALPAVAGNGRPSAGSQG